MPKLDAKWYKRKTHLQIGTVESIASSGLSSQKEITPKKASDHPLTTAFITPSSNLVYPKDFLMQTVRSEVKFGKS